MTPQEFSEAVGFPVLETWDEVIDLVKVRRGPPIAPRWSDEITKSGQYVSFDGISVARIKWEDGRWQFHRGSASKREQAGFETHEDLLIAMRPFLDTLPPPEQGTA